MVRETQTIRSYQQVHACDVLPDTGHGNVSRCLSLSNTRRVPVVGFDGYALTKDGQLWSCRNSQGACTDNWRQLKPKVNKDGYRVIALHCSGKPHHKRIARLMLEAFVGACPSGHQACHKNGARTDDQIANLYWGTAADNCHDRECHGNTARGERISQSKLCEQDVRDIRRLYANREMNQYQLARQFGVNQQVIWAIIHRVRWAHVV